MQELWRLRESVGEALRRDGCVYKYDVSLPLRSFMAPVALLRERLPPQAVRRVCGFGHLGDSNLHLNVTSGCWDEALLAALEPFVYEWTAAHGGSISAEHGIGRLKRRYLHLARPPAAIEAMRRLKHTFDPRGILNPYKMLPPEQ